MEKKSFKLALLTADLKISNITCFELYLKEVWIDLISRITKNENDKINQNSRQDLVGVTKLIFSKYYSLPGIIGDRLFRVFDTNNNGVLEYNEFRMGMITLFYEKYEKTLRFFFDFYDFDGDGKISKEDIKVVLLYVSYTNEKESNNEDIKNNNIMQENDNTYLYNIKLNNILNKIFNNQQDQIGYIDFVNIIEKVNSDIYFMIYIFLLQKKPFCYKSIDLYLINSNNIKSPNEKNLYINLDYFSASNLNLNKPFINNNSAHHRNKTKTFSSGFLSKNQINNTNTNSSVSLKFLLQSKSKNNIRRSNFEKTELYKNRKNNLFEQDFENTIYEARLPYEIYEEFDNISYYEEVEESEEEENENNINKINQNLESENNNYEGYIYKLNNGKMVKVWFKLFYKDLFYYKRKEDINHRGMHNLSGLFLLEEPTKILDNKIYYSFSLIFPSKKRVYFCDNKIEFKNWKKYLKIATNYSNVLEMYKIMYKIGSGSFCDVKLAINKVTNQKVAVKIMDKKKMSSIRLESARTEIEIMKICQFPYIIKFIEAYENIDLIYIFMEYCPGGTLFEFLKKRNFLLKEELAVKIIYKICLAVYYFHSYGITHRDLKPENILMTSQDDDADIRILDFGLGKIIGPGEKCSEPYGTIIYVAPEIIKNKPYSKNVDSWSLGIISFIMLFGKIPFFHKERKILKEYIVKYEPTYKGNNLNNISEESINFIQNLLIKDPDKRMTIGQALEHKWFQKYKMNDFIKLNFLNSDKKSVIELYNSLNMNSTDNYNRKISK